MIERHGVTSTTGDSRWQRASSRANVSLIPQLDSKALNSHRDSVVESQDAISPVTLEASLEESTGGSSQQQSTGNSNDRQPSLHEPNASNGERTTHSSRVHDAPSNQDASNSQFLARKPSILKEDERVQASESSTATTVASKRCHQCQDLDEAQWHPQTCDGCVRASGNGMTISPSPCEKKGLSKKARPGLWCKDCLTLKGLPGEGNRTRRNAKHGCPDCATLREEAGLPRGKRKSAASSTPKGQGTSQAGRSQSEPGNSRSTPKKEAGLSRSNRKSATSLTRKGQGSSPAQEAQSEPRNSGATPKKAGLSQRATHKTFADIWQRQNGKTAQPASNKPGKLAVDSKQQHERNRGFDPSTESDDLDNPPKPIKNSTQVDVFGRPKDHPESVRQIQENFRRWEAQPPAAAGRSSDFFDEDGTPNRSSTAVPTAPAPYLAPLQMTVLPGTGQASGHSDRTLDPTLPMNDPSQVAGELQQPSRYEDHTEAMSHTPQMGDSIPSLENNNANGAQQQRPGEESGAFALSAPVPDPFPGAPSGPNEPQRNAGSLRDFMYPDPMEFSRPSTHFEDAMSDIERSRTFETSSPAPFDDDRRDTEWPIGFEASPASFDLSGMPESADPEPADPPATQRHPGMRDSSIDPMLSDVPTQLAASTSPANSSPAITNNNENNGEQDGEEEDMFD